MELKDIKLVKGMTKEKVNELTKNHILLEDEVYLGNNHKHTWKCLRCNINIIESRTWKDIKFSKTSTICGCCRYEITENKYRFEVEKDNNYEYLDSFRSGEITPNGKIVTDVPYIQIKHKYCGSVYEIKSISFINSNNRCSNCCHKYENSFAYHIEVELGLKLEDVWDFEKNTVNPYHIYKNYNKSKVWIKCKNEEVNELNGLMKKDYHGSYLTTCNKFYSGRRCPCCSSKEIHPYDSFGYHNLDKVQSWHPDNGISPFRVARISNKKYKFICGICGNIWSSSPSIISSGHWCPKCTISKGEDIIKNYLIKNNISFKYQYRIKGCRFKNELPFDFAIFKDNSLFCLIEYDGRQHYEIVKAFGGINGFVDTKIRDTIKNKYCKDNDITLIRIPFWELRNISIIMKKLKL